tara:strand:+ start:448 stop:786 length:339 start_codon:yes stop_codon:yes gene_type:complete
MPKLPKGKKKKWIASSKKKTGFTKEHISENSDFYNSRRWRELRKWHIERNPICEWCKEEGIINIKERIIVDHIKEIQDGGEGLDPNNLQTLCLSHHNQKTNWEKKKRRKKSI